MKSEDAEVQQEQEALAGNRHWPEPWMSIDTRRVAVLNDMRHRERTGYVVGNSFGDKTHAIADRISQKDADRIVACVNFCKGVPMEVLEKTTSATPTGQPTETRPGPETDRDVVQIIAKYGAFFASVGFCPSSNWRDAMVAATKMRLFEELYDRELLAPWTEERPVNSASIWTLSCDPDEDVWRMHLEAYDTVIESVSAPTGPMAICRAIQKEG